MGLQSQAVKDLWGMKESLLGQRPYDYEQKPQGFLESLFGGGGPQEFLLKLLSKQFGI